MSLLSTLALTAIAVIVALAAFYFPKRIQETAGKLDRLERSVHRSITNDWLRQVNETAGGTRVPAYVTHLWTASKDNQEAAKSFLLAAIHGASLYERSIYESAGSWHMRIFATSSVLDGPDELGDRLSLMVGARAGAPMDSALDGLLELMAGEESATLQIGPLIVAGSGDTLHGRILTTEALRDLDSERWVRQPKSLVDHLSQLPKREKFDFVRWNTPDKHILGPLSVEDLPSFSASEFLLNENPDAAPAKPPKDGDSTS